jgi:transcriptional regulator with XRE-family HTH domain
MDLSTTAFMPPGCHRRPRPGRTGIILVLSRPMVTDDRHDQLGDFLRSRRERLAPEAFGLPTARRRTPGLRREEVAALAGIGVDWYIRLEQGRCVRPSAATIDALARALRLGPVEHDHLRILAGTADRPAFVRESVPDPLRQLVDELPQPAYITGRRWDVLAWNGPAEALFGFAGLAEDDRNTFLYLLTSRRARRAFGAGWAEQAERVVAQFRATHDQWAGDPAFTSLVQRARAGCPELAAWWKRHDVRRSAAGTKLLDHPTKGRLRFTHASFQSSDDPRLRLVIYTAQR